MTVLCQKSFMKLASDLQKFYHTDTSVLSYASFLSISTQFESYPIFVVMKKIFASAKWSSLLVSEIPPKILRRIGSRGLYYKKLRIHNLRKMDRFCGKLVTFLLSVTFAGLDKYTNLGKHTSLLRNP